jgi:glycosyltransferase involved in cell wall biosynthesis
MARLGFQPVKAKRETPARAVPSGVFPLSICMIVKNEEANLPGLLESVAPLGAELVVVDTGSSDATVRIAEAAGAKVVHWAWIGDFAAARNVSLEHATRPWIVWMDADDRLPEASLQPLKDLVKERPAKAYTFLVKNTTNGGASGSEFSQLRMFPNHPRIRFTGAVHEQVYPALQALGIPYDYLPIVVHHTGYLDKDVIRAKQERNRQILREEVRRNPDHAMVWFQLGSAHSDCGDLEEAEACFRKSLDRIAKGDPDHHLKSILPAHVAVLRVKREDWAGAKDVFEELVDPDPSTWHPNQLSIVAQVWLRAVSPEAATEWFDKAYTPPQAKVLLPVDPKMTSLLPLQNLAEYWRGVGRESLAVAFLHLLKSVMGDVFPPRRAIPDAYLSNGLPSRAAELYAWCIDKDGPDPGVWAGLVRATAMAGDPESAAGFLDAGLQRWPGDPQLTALAGGAS